MDTINQSTETKAKIFEQLKSFIIEVIGEDFVEPEDITTESMFSNDLEMESIEIVQLSDLIKDTYGEGIDFTGWLSTMDLEEIINLKLGTVLDYLVKEKGVN